MSRPFPDYLELYRELAVIALADKETVQHKVMETLRRNCKFSPAAIEVKTSIWCSVTSSIL